MSLTKEEGGALLARRCDPLGDEAAAMFGVPREQVSEGMRSAARERGRTAEWARRLTWEERAVPLPRARISIRRTE